MFKTKFQLFAITLFCLTLTVAITSFASADVLELLNHGTSGYINDAYFIQVDPDNSTGTGVISPFLRIQKSGIEEGYNTDYRPHQFPEATDSWTKSLLLTAVPVVNIGGTDYREFLLDINESGGGGNQFLSLDKLQFFMGSAGNLTGYPSGLGTMIWDMDAGLGGDSWISLDYSLESGSGDGDMLAYIPSSLFTGGDYVYLYSMFGSEGDGLDASDGFEEWSVREPVPVVPEPASLLVLSTGLISMLGMSLKRRRQKSLS